MSVPYAVDHIVPEDIADPHAADLYELPGRYESRTENDESNIDPKDKSEKEIERILEPYEDMSTTTEDRGEIGDDNFKGIRRVKHTGEHQRQIDSLGSSQATLGNSSQTKTRNPVRGAATSGDTWPKTKRPRGRPRKLQQSMERQETGSNETMQLHSGHEDSTVSSSAVSLPASIHAMSDFATDLEDEPNYKDTAFATGLQLGQENYKETPDNTTLAGVISSASEPKYVRENVAQALKFDHRYAKRKDIRGVNIGIYNCLKKKRNVPQKEEDRCGWIYIMESSSHLKIGKTRRGPGQRKDELEKCHGPLVEVRDTFGNAFDYHTIVEALVHAEFYNERKKTGCRLLHHDTHDEWFQVDSASALKSVHVWRKWMRTQTPFDHDWKLIPYWKWRVKNLQKDLDNVRWEEWTQPGPVDKLRFHFEEFDRKYRLGIVHHLLERKDKHFWLVGCIIVLLLLQIYGLSKAIWAFLALLAI
jgi:hypothetical protein